MLAVRRGVFLDYRQMLLVDALAAAAIRLAYNVAHSSRALAQMRNWLPEIVDDETATFCARMIAGCWPMPRGRLAIERWRRSMTVRPGGLTVPSSAEDRLDF
jgi:hypothetical protein